MQAETAPSRQTAPPATLQWGGLPIGVMWNMVAASQEGMLVEIRTLHSGDGQRTIVDRLAMYPHLLIRFRANLPGARGHTHP
jgi:hypothetical protein